MRIAVGTLVWASLAGCAGEPLDVEPPCPPPRAKSAIVFGTVVEAAGSPIPRANLVILGTTDQGSATDTIGECVGFREWEMSALSDAVGSYRERVFSVFAERMCLTVIAEAGGLTGMASGESVELRTDLGRCTPESAFDSARLDVVVGG
ncbi:MAG: hypothetical protein ACE5HP_12085 [Gemmatimonadota bacterium]